MKIIVRHHMDAIAILDVKGGLTKASALLEFQSICRELHANRKRAVLVNLSQCTRVNMAGLAALVELAGRLPNLHVAYCSLGQRVSRKLEATGLDRGLNVHQTEQDALRSRPFQNATLTHTKALILCNDNPISMAPMSKSVPTCLLDLFGKPVIARLRKHLDSFGIEDVIVNPAHLGNQVSRYFQRLTESGCQVRFSNEGSFQNGEWIPEPLGTAGSIAQVQEMQSAFYEDFFVLAGNSLVDVDLAAMMQHHKAQKADVTIAISAIGNAAQCDASAMNFAPTISLQRNLGAVVGPAAYKSAPRGSVCILSPKVFDAVQVKSDWDIVQDFLPALYAVGRKINIFRSTSQSFQFDSAHKYANFLQQILKGNFSNLIKRPACGWHSNKAEISAKARLPGLNYIGPGARIGAGVELLGNCVVGAGADISGSCVIENSIVFPGTHIASGFWGRDLTIHKDWTFDHRFKGSVEASEALNLVWGKETLPEPNRKSA